MNRSLLLGVALGITAFLPTREAKAEGTVSLDLHAAALFPSGYTSSLGTNAQASLGGAIYGGYAFRLSKVYVEPEVAVSVDDLPNLSLLNVRALGGARLGFAFKVEPSIYAHVGGAFFKPLHSGPFSSLAGSFTLDAGLGLDYRVAKFFTIGLTAGYIGFFGGNDIGKINGIVAAPRVGFWF